MKKGLLLYKDLDKDALLNFAACSEYDVRDMWYRPGDGIEDLETLTYSWNAPLYVKMIFRFREGGAVGLFNGVDPCNRKLLADCFHLPVAHLEFFCFIKYGLAPVEVDDVEAWRASPIKWFFAQERKALVERYNTEVIHKYNKAFIQ